MQKIATHIFIVASVAFGIIGVSLAIFGEQNDNVEPNITLMKLLMICVFIILPSFALSIAGKYLSNKS